MDVVLNVLSVLLVLVILALATVRGLLKQYVAESEKAERERESAFLIGLICGAIAVVGFVCVEVGTLPSYISGTLIVLLATGAVIFRIIRERALLAECKMLREERKSANRQSP